MKLNVGDVLFESMSQNIGAITKIFDHPDGKISKFDGGWRVTFPMTQSIHIKKYYVVSKTVNMS